MWRLLAQLKDQQLAGIAAARAAARQVAWVFLDNSGEFLAGLLRPGNAGADTAADHITVLDQALAQLPDPTATALRS